MSLCKIKMPDLGEGMTECEIVEWHVRVGDPVKEDDVLAAVMTDKAVVEIPSPVDGVITSLSGEVGELVPVGTVIVVLEVADDSDTPTSSAHTETDISTPLSADDNQVPLSPKTTEQTLKASITTNTDPFNPQTGSAQTLCAPAVRQRAKSLNIELSLIQGSGPEGRILHKDIDRYLLNSTPPSALSPPPSSTPTTIPIIGLRRKIAERMQAAKQRIPHITYVEGIDVTELETLRHHLNRQKSDDQQHLTLLPLLFRAIVLATRIYPVMNAHYDDEAGELHQYPEVNFGVATQTDKGLLVPVLSRAEQMDIWQASAGIHRLSTLARRGVLSRDELSGSTITCSSLGKLGGLISTPVINSPEVCIIGVNKIQTQPVYQGSQFVPRQIMNLSCSFDHRIIDGHEAAQFVRCLKEHLEHPATLFMAG